MYLQLSEDQAAAISLLLRLDLGVRESLATALDVLPRSLDVMQVAADLSSDLPLEVTDLSEIVDTLAGLDWHLRSGTFDSVDFKEVALQALGEDVSPARLEESSVYLARVCDSRTTRLMGKARTMTLEHTNLIYDSRIITDIRPIFPDESDNVVQGALITQELRMTYFDSQVKLDEFRITLDQNALEELSKSIQRALNKAGALTELLQQAELPHGDGESHD